MDLPPALEKRVGPFPVAGWLAIGGAGVGLGWAVKRSGFLDSFDQDQAFPDPEGEGVKPPYGTLVTGLAGGGGGAVALPSGQTPVEAPTGDLTNEQWLRTASGYLRSQGVDALLADTALRKYLKGDPLTTQQSNAVKLALQAKGPPPEGAAPAIVTPDKPTVPPNKVPKPTPPVGHPPLVGGKRVQSDGNLTAGALAKFVYGGQNWWIRIRDANPGLVTSPWGRIPKGKWVILP